MKWVLCETAILSIYVYICTVRTGNTGTYVECMLPFVQYKLLITVITFDKLYTSVDNVNHVVHEIFMDGVLLLLHKYKVDFSFLVSLKWNGKQGHA